jgi:hypothetical protein
MTDSPSPIDRASRITPVTPLEHQRRERAALEEVAAPPEAASFDGIPSSPPDEVLAEVDAAMAHLDALRAAGTSVSIDAGSGAGLRIALTGEDGSRREIGAAELFDLAAGRGDASTTGPAGAPVDDGGEPPHVDRKA